LIRLIGENDMPTVTVIGHGVITGSFVYNGTTYYEWTFVVNVDGQVGLYTVSEPTNDRAYEPEIINGVIWQLENNPDWLEGLGIGNDPGTDMGDDGVTTDDDDDGGALAGNDGGDFGDSV
jgi:hypothetical protein